VATHGVCISPPIIITLSQPCVNTMDIS
jgi:hypothetical protein